MVELKLQLPESFLEEEVRCDYTVSQEMKKVWAVELDLLVQLQKVCEKYGIRYCVSGGTILGAVRHKGFIPWDDDIDVMMPRDQYEELCKHADEFEEPYFFQTAWRDKGYYAGHAKLRNSLTTGIQRRSLPRGRKYNQGIFVDVFPIDAVPDDETARKEQGERCEKYKQLARKVCYRLDYPPAGRRQKLTRPLYRCLNAVYPHLRIYEKFEKECQRYNGTDTKLVSKLCLDATDPKLYQERSDFDEFIWVDFEFIRVPIPKTYDRYLSYKYGNYMEFVRDLNYHGGLILDADTPYPEWIKQHADLFRQ